MPDPDYYEILGVPRDADAATIKRAFRELARQHHPDNNPDDPDAAEKFKRIGEAYAVLNDPQRRAQFDRYGRVSDGPGFDAQDLDFESVFGDLGTLFQAMFGGAAAGYGSSRPRTGPRSGQSLAADVVLTLEEAATGVEREFNYSRMAACPTCFGTGAASGGRERCSLCGGHGRVQQSHRTLRGHSTVLTVCPQCEGEGTVVLHPCERCHGKGRVETPETRTVKIPAGVDDGMRVRVAGAGDAGWHGGPDGDLFINVRVRPHPVFQREGMDLHCELPISFAQAALGDTVTVPGILDEQRLTLPSGTQTGKTFRLAGAGLPSPRSPQQRGDQFVTVRVVTPTDLSPEEKELLFQFAQRRGEHPSEPEEKGFFEKLRERLTRR